ncbi:MAG: ABC transporter substrate-binding protein [Treponema sp.]|jgi:simple sugar transport system substrate-binding protein|nr:ABC transporter substrate-binding protein [Treponema sp.]
MKFWQRIGFYVESILILTVLCFSISSCKKTETEADHPSQQIILGFSQIGAESAWRNQNTLSIQNAAEEAGIQLLFTNAEQKQENQIRAIRSFIAYQVDVIAFVPIVTNGWDNVLREAKDAGIPVLVTDRQIDIQDESLYAGSIGTDSVQAGRRAGLFLLEKFRNSTASAEDPIRIVELTGNVGSSVAIDRGVGFREIIEKDPRFEIIYSESGDFLRSKGYELMQSILNTYDDIDVLYSHNDSMTLGSLDAMTEKGINPGTDITIVSIDAEQAAINALQRGKVNCVIECNPKTGPEIMRLVKSLAAGEGIPRQIYVQEKVFREDDDLSDLEPRGY